jgi:hypothetical protein
MARIVVEKMRYVVVTPEDQPDTYLEDYWKLNSKKYRPMAARKESRNVLSGRR